MKLADIDFEVIQIVKKRCVDFAKDGRIIVKPYRKLFPLTSITNNSKHDSLFLEIVQRDHYKEHFLWEQLTDFCIITGVSPRYIHLEDLVKAIDNYKYFGVQGFLSLLKTKEENGVYISLRDIEVCKLLKMPELAAHYAEYREAYIQRREEKERAEREQWEQREQEEKARQVAEEERRLQEAEDLIRNHKTLYNRKEPSDRSIVLALMRRHGIQVPLRTQGWINSALYSINFNQEEISYQYYSSSSDSRVFKKYLLLLEEKINSKGDGNKHAD